MPPIRTFLGDIVIYRPSTEDGVLSPAVVIRTRDTTVQGLVEAMDPTRVLEEGEVDLLVLGLEQTYREYKVPYGLREPGAYFAADQLTQALHG